MKTNKEKIKTPISKKVDEEIRQKRFRKSKDFNPQPQILTGKEKFVDEVAKKGANEFQYQQIIEAASSNGVRGLEIYGWLETKYPDHWEMLLKEGILDKMAMYSYQNYRPEFVNVMSEIQINEYVKTPVTFSEEIDLGDEYPDRKFRRAVFYAPKPLREYIKWMNMYELYIDGYKTNVVLGKVSLILLGWALPDYPQILIAYTPSQNQAIFEAQIKAENLSYDIQDLLKKIIFYYRRENEVNKMKVIEAKIDKERFEKRWSHAMDKMETERPDDPQEPRQEPKVIYQTNPIVYITMGILGVFAVIFLLLALF